MAFSALGSWYITAHVIKFSMSDHHVLLTSCMNRFVRPTQPHVNLKKPSWYDECDKYDTYSIKHWVTSIYVIRFARLSPQPSSSGSDQTASPSFTIMRRFSSTTRRTSNCDDVILQFAEDDFANDVGWIIIWRIPTQSFLSFVGGSLVRALCHKENPK